MTGRLNRLILEWMDPIPRHQCLVYSGSPNLHLRPVSLVIREMLKQNHRCIYLNSQPMVAGMRSYLAAAGLDVEEEVRASRLILSSERPHLVDDRFEIDGMLRSLQSELDRALLEGYAGLWATGDMTWEMGLDQDVTKLVKYERSLDEFLRAHPQMGGVCQYHAETLPKELVDQGLRLHPAIFINETLSILNAQFVSA
jgi:MEDS: MEthanogen/methylotroph, DcmR Sensory domain